MAVTPTRFEVFDPCATPPPRCRTRIEPPYSPGISVRHSPNCQGGYCGLFACDGGNWRVASNGTLDRSKWIEGWIISQLFTRGQVECAEHPLGKRDGGWWLDSFRRDQFRSGSKLWSLQWGDVTNATLVTAKQYATEALQYLLKWGIVRKLEITPMYVSRHVMHIHIRIEGPGVSKRFVLEGQAQPYADWLWKEYKPGIQKEQWW